MRSHVQKSRVLTTLGFFFIGALFSFGVADGATPMPLGPNAATAAARQGVMRYYQQLERQSPMGSRVYAIDRYVIVDGNDSLTQYVDTTFRRDRAGRLYVTNMESGYTWGPFSSRATVERFNNIEEIIVPPGKSDPVVKRLIKLGGARLIKVVGSSSPAHAKSADDTCTLVGFLQPNPLCISPQKQWGGGGQGQIYGTAGILTSLFNNCSPSGESTVVASYTVPSSYTSAVQATLCGGPGGHNICAYVPGPGPGHLSDPGISHNVTVTIAGGGAFNENLAFNGTTVQSGSLPGCMYMPGCSSAPHY